MPWFLTAAVVYSAVQILNNLAFFVWCISNSKDPRELWNWRMLISIGPVGPMAKWLDKNRPGWGQ